MRIQCFRTNLKITSIKDLILTKIFGEKVNSKILKSFINFNSLEELLKIVEEFEQHLISLLSNEFI